MPNPPLDIFPSPGLCPQSPSWYCITLPCQKFKHVQNKVFYILTLMLNPSLDLFPFPGLCPQSLSWYCITFPSISLLLIIIFQSVAMRCLYLDIYILYMCNVHIQWQNNFTIQSVKLWLVHTWVGLQYTQMPYWEYLYYQVHVYDAAWLVFYTFAKFPFIFHLVQTTA